MQMALRILDPLRSKVVDTVTAYLSGTDGTAGTIGLLRVFGGTQPGTAGATSGTQGTLVAIEFIAWAAGSNGTAVITGTRTGTAGATGTAAWARLSGSDGTGYVIDGGCGTASTQDFVIDVAGITADSIITLSTATIVMPAS
jgi:hypothetical protein